MLIRSEPKQDLGLDSKLVKVLQRLFTVFSNSRFLSLVIRLSHQPSRAGRTPDMEVFFTCFFGEEESLPTAAAPQVILV